jgi:catechol 2,3-dioxygenase-like lactoylglutathione lyase family enzyme
MNLGRVTGLKVEKQSEGEPMFKDTPAYSGFAVDDIARAREFYGETLGIETAVLDEDNGLLQLQISGDRPTLVYLKPDYAPATYTILNFPVEDVEATVDALAERGVECERYEDFEQDDKGIAHGPGPTIAWFRDPAGNILSVHEQQ